MTDKSAWLMFSIWCFATEHTVALGIAVSCWIILVLADFYENRK